MSEGSSKSQLPPALRGGKDLSKLLQRQPRLSPKQRIRSWFSRGRLIVIGLVTALVVLVTLANSMLDLWNRTGGKEDVSTVDVDFRTSHPLSGSVSDMPDDLPVWDNSESGCRDWLSHEPVPVDEKLEEDQAAGLGDEPIGLGSEDSPRSAAPWFHQDIIDFPQQQAGIDDVYDELEAIQAVQTGSHIVDVYIANRTPDPLLVTNVSLQVEREPVPEGTVIVLPLGDAGPVTALGFDLDEADPVAREGETDELGECVLGGAFFDSYQVEVEPDRAEAIKVGLHEGDCWCQVRLQVEYWHEGEWSTEVFPAEDEAPITVVGAHPTTELGRLYTTATGTNGEGVAFERRDCTGLSFDECSALEPE